MRRIRSENTKPELLLRSRLFREGLRFRIHRRDLPGKPDIVLSKYGVVVFVNGCFWHYHRTCPDGRIPSSHSHYWRRKLMKNVKRDAMNIKSLKLMGWKVVVVWECEVENQLEKVVKILLMKLSP